MTPITVFAVKARAVFDVSPSIILGMALDGLRGEESGRKQEARRGAYGWSLKECF